MNETTQQITFHKVTDNLTRAGQLYGDIFCGIPL